MKIGDEPAFPAPETFAGPAVPGMTMREWYAGRALTGFCACPLTNFEDASVEGLVRLSFRMADAMIVESQRERVS